MTHVAFGIDAETSGKQPPLLISSACVVVLKPSHTCPTWHWVHCPGHASRFCGSCALLVDQRAVRPLARAFSRCAFLLIAPEIGVQARGPRCASTRSSAREKYILHSRSRGSGMPISTSQPTHEQRHFWVHCISTNSIGLVVCYRLERGIVPRYSSDRWPKTSDPGSSLSPSAPGRAA